MKRAKPTRILKTTHGRRALAAVALVVGAGVFSACGTDEAFDASAQGGAGGSAGDGGAAGASGGSAGSGGSTAGSGGSGGVPYVQPESFKLRPGVEIVTVTDATEDDELTLTNAAGERLMTIIADRFGQAHFAYVPEEYLKDDSENGTEIPTTEGTTLRPGDGYVITNDSADPPEASEPFRVLAIDEHPDPKTYDGQTLEAESYGLLDAQNPSEPETGFGYITMRDGVQLSVMVRLPEPGLYGDGPYPTVIEYSGYSPSRPDGIEPGSQIATLLGYATVGVNMRGSGCSGGVFDVFSAAQQADGYDIVEIIARQPWSTGNVGMVGLSYSGIAQLFVAHLRPPSLAAITPLSVLADAWGELWPGGIYNDGFTRQWLAERDRQASSGGQSWTDKRVAAGDQTCAKHQDLRNQNIQFETFFKQLEFYPPEAKDRSLPTLVPKVDVPVYLTGAFQDEQTGGQYGNMLDKFTSTNVRKFTMFNGRHPDGYSPLVLMRWYEFLEFYVAKRVPKLPPVVRAFAGPEFGKQFGVDGLMLEPDRFPEFTQDDYAAALAKYEAEPEVRILFENGAGGSEPGAPVNRFEQSFSTWPPAEAVGKSFYLEAGGVLADAEPTQLGIDLFEFDADAGDKTFFGPKGYQLLVPLWDIDWQQQPAGKSLSYVTSPLTEDVVVAGPSYAELFFASEATDANVQVTVTEVRPDDTEFLVQSGWLRIGHRKVDTDASDTFRIERTFAKTDYQPLTPGEFVNAKVALPPVAHAFRAGSRLRVVISTPGRDHGTWEFENPMYASVAPTHRVAHGPGQASRLFVPVVDGVPVASGLPDCPSLRGQPCRTYVPSVNTSE